MRITVDDITFEDNELSQLVRNAKVFLDGTEVKYCIVADTDKNLVEKYLVDENDKFILDELGKEALTCTEFGKVQILDTRTNTYVE